MGDNHLTRSIMDAEDFTVTWELVPGRGAVESNIEDIFRRAGDAAAGEEVDGITITDNPGGNPAMSAEFLGMKIRELGIEPLVHFSCKDKSRNEIESFLYSLEREGVSNILVLTGDYPVSGYRGRSKPVFDYDSVQALDLITALNEGLEFRDAFGRPNKLQPTNFFQGAGVSPFKKLEPELMVQYYKLEKKIAAGARYIITQLGYDARKFHEVLQFIRNNFTDIPVIGNLYVLPYGAAKAMNANRIPGCVVTDKLLSQLAEESEADDRGKGARLLRAAKMYALMKGMGFDGAHIGGHGLEYDDVKYIVTAGEELVADWREYVPEFDFPQKDGFYLYKKDEETGLNKPGLARRSYRGSGSLHNSLFRFVHGALFEPDSPLFRPMQYLARGVDDTCLERPFQFCERLIKTLSNDCQECGDCALLDLAYLCPMSQCPKNQRNGACGGSRDGWCEVYPEEKKCIYVRIYERLKLHEEERTIAENYVPPVNWDLHHTSSWLNFYLGRDHSARSMDINPPGD